MQLIPCKVYWYRNRHHASPNMHHLTLQLSWGIGSNCSSSTLVVHTSFSASNMYPFLPDPHIPSSHNLTHILFYLTCLLSAFFDKRFLGYLPWTLECSSSKQFDSQNICSFITLHSCASQTVFPHECLHADAYYSLMPHLPFFLSSTVSTGNLLLGLLW